MSEHIKTVILDTVRTIKYYRRIYCRLLQCTLCLSLLDVGQISIDVQIYLKFQGLRLLWSLILPAS